MSFYGGKKGSGVGQVWSGLASRFRTVRTLNESARLKKRAKSQN